MVRRTLGDEAVVPPVRVRAAAGADVEPDGSAADASVTPTTLGAWLATLR